MSEVSIVLEKLGFWETETEEEHITIYGMDFPENNSYILITDDGGKTPEDNRAPLIIACYDNNDCFQWGKELKNLFILDEIFGTHTAGSTELLQDIQNYVVPPKK